MSKTNNKIYVSHNVSDKKVLIIETDDSFSIITNGSLLLKNFQLGRPNKKLIIKAQNIVLIGVKIVAEETEVKIKEAGLFYKTNLFSLSNASISIKCCTNIIANDHYSTKEYVTDFLQDKFTVANLKDMQHPELQPTNLIGMIEEGFTWDFSL